MIAARRVLSPRQAQILALVAEGLGDKEIARRMGVSTNTVRTHLQRLYRERGVRNRAEAAALWVGLQSEALVVGSPSIAPADPPAPVALEAPRPKPSLLIALVASLVLLGLLLAATYGPPLYLRGVQPIKHSEAAAPAAALSAEPMPTGQVEADSQPAPVVATTSPAQGSTPASTPSMIATQKAPPPSQSPAVDPPNPPKIVAVPAIGMLALLNADRAGAVLQPLAWNDCLAKVAMASAQQMAALGNLSSGFGTAGDLACHAGQAPIEISEYWSSPDPAQLNTVLMSNPGHRKAVLGQYHAVGAAWASAPNGVTYLVVELD